jgi:hydroxyacylglutathione hydrolase
MQDGTPSDTTLAQPVGPGIRRIVAPNTGPLTGAGTNTYLLGSRCVTVIDPGPCDRRHLDAILSALEPHASVAAIVVTHGHVDHSGLVPLLKAATGAPTVGYGGPSARAGRPLPGVASVDTEGVDAVFTPDILLADGGVINAEGTALHALHTPGHLGDHLCFLAGDVLFSGDHVMGWSTTLVAPPHGDMGAYMRSLDRLAGIGPICLLPGHGEAVADGQARVAELARHRRAREMSIRAALAEGPAAADALARRLYVGTPAALMPAAALSVFAHLVDLMDRNIVDALGPVTPETAFRHRPAAA